MYSKIILLSGLPASGKTEWAKKYAKTNDAVVISFDDHLHKPMQDVFKDSHPSVCADEYILDGLFLTDDDRINVIREFADYMYKRDDYLETFRVVIEEWDENREACLHNDMLRGRETSAAITIKNAEFKPANIDEMKSRIEHPDVKFIDWKINHHAVEKYELADAIISKYGGWEGKIVSESWCGGGTWANCWGGEGTVPGEPAKEFDTLDEILEEYCPNITFIQYKNLVRECTSIEDWREGDYYGGSTTNYRHVCNVEKLVECIKKYNGLR